MKVRNALDEVFATPAHVRVLRVLSSRKHLLTGRQVARETGLHHKSAIGALERLELLGLVERQRGGRDHLFSLNRQHSLARNVLSPLFKAEQQFRKSLENRLAAAGQGITESLVLFGSTARGEEKSESDLDICVVTSNASQRRKAERQLHAASKDLSEEFGVRVAWLFLSVEDLRRRSRQGDALLNDLLSDGKVLAGKPLSEVLRNAEIKATHR